MPMWWWEQIPHRELGPIRGPLPHALMPPRTYTPGTLQLAHPTTYSKNMTRNVTASQLEANRNAGGSGIPGGDAGGGGEDVASAERATAAEAAHLTAIGERQAAPLGRSLGLIAGLALGGIPGAVRGVLKDVLGVTISGVRTAVATPAAVIAPDAPLVIPDGLIFTDPYTGLPSVIADPTQVPSAFVDGPVQQTVGIISDAPAPVDAVSAPVEAVGVSMADLSVDMQADVEVNGPGVGQNTTGQVGQEITSGADFGSQAGAQAGADASSGTGGIDASGGGGTGGGGAESNAA